MRHVFLTLLVGWIGTAACLAQAAPPGEGAGETQAIFRRLLDFIGGKTADFQTSFNSRSETRAMRGSVHFIIERPNLFRIEASAGRVSYSLVSDGQVMTIYNPQQKKYVELRAPESAAQGLALLTGLSSMQSQLLRLIGVLDDAAKGSERIKVIAAGAETVGDRQCDRFTIVENADSWYPEKWEVWLEQKDVPLPCKFVVSSSDGLSNDVQTNEFVWRPANASSESFKFTPPSGSKKVESVGELGLGPAF